MDYDLDRFDVTARQTVTQTDLVRLRKVASGAVLVGLRPASSGIGDRAVIRTLEQVDFVHHLIERYPDRLSLALCAADVEGPGQRNDRASLLGAEGGHSIGSSLGVLRILQRLGVRYLTLTHNVNVPWADAALDSPCLGGLSDFGRLVVREMNRLGMLVDLSHVAAVGTMRDALETTSAPVIFSHSSARALCDHARKRARRGAYRPCKRTAACAWSPSSAALPSRRTVGPGTREVVDDMRVRGEDPGDWAAYTAAVQARAAKAPPPTATVSPRRGPHRSRARCGRVEHRRTRRRFRLVAIRCRQASRTCPATRADRRAGRALAGPTTTSRRSLRRNILRVLADAESVQRA